MTLAPTFRALDEALRAGGAASPFANPAVGEALARHSREGGTTPWFVTLLSGVGAWLAALCFFAFLACAGVLDSEVLLLLLGIGCFGVGLVLRRLGVGIFVDQVGLALVMCGPAAIVTAVEQLGEGGSNASASLLLVSLVALATIPDAIVAFLFTLGVVASATFLLIETRATWADEASSVVVVALVLALFARGESRLPRALGRLFTPVTNGLFMSALGLLVFRALGHRLSSAPPTWFEGGLDIAVLVVLTAISIAAACLAISASATERKAELMGLAALFFIVLAGLTHRMPELVCATGLVVLAFHRHRPMLVAIACAMTMCAGGLYYYDLSLTLLEKSIAMFAAGVVFLVARKVVAWRFVEPDAAHVEVTP